MYDTLEFYDSNGCDLKEVLKSCIYKYYMANKKVNERKKSIIDSNKVNMLSTERG